MRIRCPEALLLGTVLACRPEALPAEGQYVVFVDTDAPLPSLDRAAAPALFDRLRVEILLPGASSPCAGCTREFPLTAETIQARAASFGLVAAGEPRVRVRLYRAAWLVDGDPPPPLTLETVTLLPPAPTEGVTNVTVSLTLADLGRAQGTVDAPLPAALGTPVGLALADAARRKPCASPPGPLETCVPGGAIWMGDPAVATLGSAAEVDGSRPRVIALAPFYVDLHEVTVAEYRSGGLAVEGDPRVTGRCTYRGAPGPTDDLPVTCISFARAKAYCEARGRTLLTEARFEYLASGLLGQPHVWGDDDPTCLDAVFGRDQQGTVRTKACAARGTGPARAGSGDRDRLLLDGGEVLDLNGNVAEWMLDTWQPETGSCWGSGLFRDPFCGVAGPDRSIRGGSWSVFDVLTRAQPRTHLPQETKAADIGFRCARSG